MTLCEATAIECIAEVSTTEVDESGRFEYFCDAVCRVYSGIQPEPPRDVAFNANFKAYALKESVLASISAPGHLVSRGEREIRRRSDDSFFLNFCEFSSYRAEHAGKKWQLLPGMPFLIDNALPFRLDFDRHSPMMLSSLRFDRNLLNLERSGVSLLDMNVAIGSTHAGQQLASQMQLMCTARRAGKLWLADLMSRPVLGLLGVVAAEVSSRPGHERLSLDNIKSVASSHITDPDFEISFLARIFHCTVRTIQSRFAQNTESFSRWLLAERLELARFRFQVPEYSGRSTESIAYSCGFRDCSHFHRAFKARFLAPPGHFRR
ncbi:AraC family transcriptional activator of tynA and feaB [Paraburkholderia sp. EB58]|jgi:AraC family transcriptional regulator, positive regulator of tynA and feaB|uniref:helix-turn-helix domain-containing protein n=1 Tax=Paraburkholderia sp. EB58 TaxID=3035125 RepID=UPI003D193BB6